MFKNKQYDSDEDESFYGTPFPALEENQNVSKKQDIDLTVRDEKGRRRFHGAFTGGFSAGYFNSVGSKEGWTPSQFLSKKDDRNKKFDYKPEDFMDEEDFSHFGIAPKHIKAKENFNAVESFAGLRNDKELSSIDDIVKNFISLKPVSIGVKILKFMKKQSISKISKENYLNETSDNKIFPLEYNEEDLKSFFSNPKKNFYGLGHKRLTTDLNFSNQMDSKLQFSAVMNDGKKLKISGEAFGCGALDEDDGYEAEVYTYDDLSKYDYTLGGRLKHNIFNSILTDSKLYDDFKKFNENNYDQTLEKNKFKIPENWVPNPPFKTKKNKKDRKTRWSDDNSFKQENFLVENKRNFLDATKREEILFDNKSQIKNTDSLVSKNNEVIIKKEDLNKNTEIKDDLNKLIFKKPLVGFFASKFVQATDVVEKNELKPGLSTMENLISLKKSSNVKAVEIESETLVGKKNREIYQWHPHKLICKRFNIPHPFPQFPDVVGVLVMNKPEKLNNLDSYFPLKNEPKKEIKVQKPIELVETIQIEEFKAPNMNIFKTVFEISDDDDVNLSDLEDEEEIKKKENLGDNLVISNEKDFPKLLFNKSFVKKADKKQVNEKNIVEKSKSKIINLFEDEDLDIDEKEGVNLFDEKRNLKSNKNSEIFHKKKEFEEIEFKFKKFKKPDINENVELEKNLNLEKSKEKILENLEKPDLKIEKSETSELNLKNSETSNSQKDLIDVNESIDDFINQFMKSDNSNKKKKKKKDHKKHKKKKHKSDKNS